MKVTVAFAFLILGAAAVNINQQRADEYGEEDREYMYFPDDQGNVHLINLKDDPEEPAPRFNVNTGVHFNLFTRSNPEEGIRVVNGDLASLRNSPYNPRHPTRFICHGWQSNITQGININIRRAYLTQGDFNVFVIDWTAGANTINYPAAQRRTFEVGRFVGRFIDFLVLHTGTTTSLFHLAGHSLGGQVVGVAGQSTTRGQVFKVTGLDPALPLFSVSRPLERIDVRSGRHVEVIHTNGGYLGFMAPLGHTDFYPNGGVRQPGCGIDLPGTCAHSRAHHFFLESIVSEDGFWSWNCHSFDELVSGVCTVINSMKKMGTPEGVHTNLGVEGIFFLRTNGDSPFAQGRPEGWQRQHEIAV